MNARQAMVSTRNGRPLPVCVCYGQERFLVQEFIQFVIEHTIEPEYRDLALIRYQLRDTPLAEVLDDAETAPFLSPRKLIVAEDAFFLTGAKDKGKAEHDVERLQRYLHSPADYTILIFTVEADKLDERKKVVKTLKAADALIPFQPMEPDAVLKWIRTRAGKRGVSIGDEAAGLMLFNTGAHLQQIAAELDKCCTYAGEGGEITPDAVKQLVPRTVEQNVFVLIDHIVRQRHDQAVSLFFELLGQREEPVKILALLVRQFRLVLQAKWLGGQGANRQQLAAQLGVHPYAAQLAYEQSRHYDERQLARILEQLAELDYRMKTGKVDKALGLELFLLGLKGGLPVA